jgi:hypothetical protein
MAERKTVWKWFWVWDFEKEERWLNEMAEAGWALVGVGWCRYEFERCEPVAYAVRLEMHGPDEAYIAFMQEAGAEYVGRCFQWIFFRRRTEDGAFDLFSDIDSRIAHLERIDKSLFLIGMANLLIGIANALSGGSRVGILNLLVCTVLMYGLGRIRGKKEELEKERQLRE